MKTTHILNSLNNPPSVAGGSGVEKFWEKVKRVDKLFPCMKKRDEKGYWEFRRNFVSGLDGLDLLKYPDLKTGDPDVDRFMYLRSVETGYVPKDKSEPSFTYSCMGDNNKGFIYKTKSASNFVKIVCHERFCLDCSKAKANEVAKKYVEVFQHTVREFNLGGSYFFVFTLPEHLESLPSTNDKRKQIYQAIDKIMKTVIGMRSRDAGISYVNQHIVGDSDISKVRYHYHGGILPFRKSDGRIDFRPVNLDDLRALWKSALERIFAQDIEHLANPQVTMVNSVNEGKLIHRITYDLRSFADDIEQSVLRFDDTHVVIPSGDDYKLLTYKELISIWKKVREERRLQPYGLLCKLKSESVLELLKLEIQQEEEVVEKLSAWAERRVVVKREKGILTRQIETKIFYYDKSGAKQEFLPPVENRPLFRRRDC